MPCPLSIADAAWVCQLFKTSRRREGLSFSFHKEVAALPPEEAVLQSGAYGRLGNGCHRKDHFSNPAKIKTNDPLSQSKSLGARPATAHWPSYARPPTTFNGHPSDGLGRLI